MNLWIQGQAHSRVMACAEEIWKQFNENVTDIRNSLSDLAMTSSMNDEIANNERLQGIKSKSSELQKYITNSVALMPSYDVRRTQEMLYQVNGDIKSLEASIRPKKKFSFQSRTKSNKSMDKTEAFPAVSQVSDNLVTTPAHRDVRENDRDSHVIIDKVNEKIYIHTDDLERSQTDKPRHHILIKNCVNCDVSIMGTIGSIRVESTTGSKIFLGPCYTSAYIDNSTNCVVFLSAHQLRIHQSSECQLYVKVNSHPIIEDCMAMRFAPYILHYDTLLDDFETTALTSAKCWSNVVDFRWHKSIQSPNWSVIPDEDRLKSISDDIASQGWRISQTTD